MILFHEFHHSSLRSNNLRIMILSYDSISGRFHQQMINGTLIQDIRKKDIYIYIYIHIFFLIRVFFHKHSRITGLEGKGISLSPHYHFHPLHRHLDISGVITAENSPLHIGSSRNRTVSERKSLTTKLRAHKDIGAFCCLFIHVK